MNKAELQAKWGKYCDTDELVDITMALLKKHKFRNTELGVCNMLDKYFTNKQGLIEMFMQSKYYAGNMRICLDVEMTRQNDTSEIKNFCNSFVNKINAYGALTTKVDEHGKTMADYLKTGRRALAPKDFLEKEIVDSLKANGENLMKFNSEGFLESSVQKYNDIYYFIGSDFYHNTGSTISSELAEKAAKMSIPVKLTEGMKTSRAFNKICTAYGLDKAHPTVVRNADGTERTVYPYDKLFAEYSDLVSGLKRKVKFFISVNPLDYLTMSFGVNWHSCHSIATHGGWCGGTMSYMLDTTSIITFVHNEIPELIEEGKIYRNMFHFNGSTLVQSRIYPSANDGATDLYEEFRNIVQAEIANMLKVDNAWVKKDIKGDWRNHITSVGVHYKDYNSNNSSNMTYLKGTSNHNMTIGHNRICVACGGEITSSDNKSMLTHSNCR